VITDDELGAMLREALLASVSELEPSDRLWAEVDAYPARTVRSRSRSRRVRTRRFLPVVTVGVAAIFAVVLFALGRATVSPSYAVTVQSDGAVRVTLSELSGISGVNARLRRLGVPVVVVRIIDGCRTHVSMSYFAGAIHPAPRITLMPREIAKGTTVLLGAKSIGPNTVEMAIGRVKGPAPACVAPGDSGPGLASLSPVAPSPMPQTRHLDGQS